MFAMLNCHMSMFHCPWKLCNEVGDWGQLLAETVRMGMTRMGLNEHNAEISREDQKDDILQRRSKWEQIFTTCSSSFRVSSLLITYFMARAIQHKISSKNSCQGHNIIESLLCSTKWQKSTTLKRIIIHAFSDC